MQFLKFPTPLDDGSPVTKREVAALSFDACGLWTTLKEENRAPKTFSKMSSSAWEFFSWTLLANPDHAFLHWCDDGQWKLRKWAKQNYSSWTLNMGLRQKKAKKKPDVQNTETKKDDILDDLDLLRMTDQDNDKDNKGKGSSQSVSSNGDHGPSDSDQEGEERAQRVRQSGTPAKVRELGCQCVQRALKYIERHL